MCRVDVACLHTGTRVSTCETRSPAHRNLRDKVSDELGGWVHRSLEEVDDDGVETFPQRRESPEGLLQRAGQYRAREVDRCTRRTILFKTWPSMRINSS